MVVLLLTHNSADPAELVVHKGNINYQSTQDEHCAVQILNLRFVDDWSQNQVTGNNHHQSRDNYGHL